ncbi:MAG: hypothetical protein LBI33_11845 [Propionibacteriaceae bacterium]|jgi:hypothetical protein|nr:hypothetical protein [Propionibacteriaceae bacterium]
MNPLVTDIGGILVALIGCVGVVLVGLVPIMVSTRRSVSEVRDQVSNNHTKPGSDSPAPPNLRVQMDLIQKDAEGVYAKLDALADEQKQLNSEHREYRAGNDAVILEIRQAQQQNMQMTMAAINALQQGLTGLNQTVANLLTTVTPHRE